MFSSVCVDMEEMGQRCRSRPQQEGPRQLGNKGEMIHKLKDFRGNGLLKLEESEKKT